MSTVASGPPGAELFTIGQLARRAGVPARTIRFWSDAGLVPPVSRSASGYRLYDAEAAARLDLVQALRELGFGLDVVRAVLTQANTVADVAAAHVRVLDGQIRALRLRRAVLSTVARRGNTIEETLLMHKLTKLSARERQQIIDDFVDSTFAGIDPEAAAMGIARGMRQLPVGPLDDPAPEKMDAEQVDAWVELAELVADEDFRQRVRSMAMAGPRDDAPEPAPDYRVVTEHAGQALAQGIAPGSAQGQAVLDRILAPGMPAGPRAQLLGQLEAFTDARVERYWQLLAIINGWPVPAAGVPSFEWLIAALRANLTA
ncbi:MAG: MerR family transcriptional regulator [Actinomycetota bacterium]|nr:MerR family transcriptional regulator [Actinomycetota bacterium]